MSPRFIFALTLALLGGSAFCPARIWGQPAPGIFVAIPDAFPEVDARAVVVRTQGRDIVLMKESDASAATLAMSLVALSRVREAHPRTRHQQIIPITGYVFTKPLNDEYRLRLEHTLTRLASEPVRHVGNLGPGRWTRLEG